MMAQTAFTLVNPENKSIAFKIFLFGDGSSFVNLQRLPFYTIIVISGGKGKLETDFSECRFEGNTMMCFSPYQPYKISSDGELKGYALNFHSDFLCVYKHHKEVACNGVLFDNIYQLPLTKLGSDETEDLEKLTERMIAELQNQEVAQAESLVSYLKIFLISATRIKVNRQPEAAKGLANEEPFVVQQLKDAIELHYRTKHAPSHYADLLHISSKSLARIAKKHFSKTLHELISERIVIEAKRELYLTAKPVKEIAFDLGFKDEFYFSRFFKTNSDVSPQLFRNTVGFAKAEVRQER